MLSCPITAQICTYVTVYQKWQVEVRYNHHRWSKICFSHLRRNNTQAFQRAPCPHLFSSIKLAMNAVRNLSNSPLSSDRRKRSCREWITPRTSTMGLSSRSVCQSRHCLSCSSRGYSDLVHTRQHLHSLDRVWFFVVGSWKTYSYPSNSVSLSLLTTPWYHSWLWEECP